MTAELEANALAREGRLRAQLARLPRLVVAYSGGVDSAYLLAVAHQELGDAVVGLLADSPSLSREAFTQAVALTRARGIALRVVQTAELEDPQYARNDGQRCYFCKSHLFEAAEAVAQELGGAPVAYGYTADDVADYRPGHLAAQQHQVLAPLCDAGLGKTHIRLRSRALGLPCWERPASPCLASRLAYGVTVTPERLAVVEALEQILHRAGIAAARARYDGSSVRIEVAPEALPQLVAAPLREELVGRARELGVRFISLDLEGLVSGKLNRLLP
jgi:uncharacterized protein